MAVVTAEEPVAVVALRCTGAVASAAQEVAPQDAYDLVMVSRGCFSYRDSRGSTMVDATTAVLGAPGQQGETAHPAGGDSSTQLLFAPELWHGLTGREDRVPLQAHVSPAMQLTHRRLRSAASEGDRLRTQEQALLLLQSALGQAATRRTAPRRPATARQRRTLVEEATLLLVADPGQSLTGLARELACSPHHLSRVFRETTGRTVSSHRQELRFSLVLDELAAQPTDSLADVAVRCGFADHAHLTRTVRRYTGTTASALRSELSPLAARASG